MKFLWTKWTDFRKWLNHSFGVPPYILFPVNEFQWWLYARQYKPGTFYESCSLHPCRTTSCDGWDVEGVSLINGKPDSCSLQNCGVRILTKDEADELVALWNAEGERGALAKYYGSYEAADQFIKDYRP